MELLNTLLPEVLSFSRKTIAAQDPAESDSAALFGSVSTEDVAVEIRSILQADQEAGLVRVDARDVKFLGVGEGADRVKTLGRWNIEIVVRDAPGGPVRKAIEVTSQE